MNAVRHITLPAWMILAVTLLGGCMYDRHDQIPADAMMASEGDKELAFTAQHPGTVYVYNRNDNRMVYSGDMERGQTLVVDPDKDRITLDGRTVFEKGLSRGDTRRVFFKPANHDERHVIVEERQDTSR